MAVTDDHLASELQRKLGGPACEQISYIFESKFRQNTVCI